MSVRVLLADDSEAFRDGFRLLLRSLPDIELVGEARDGDEAILHAARLQPDVVVMDLTMPGRNGIEATAAIVASSPHIRVVVLSMHDDDASVLAALRAGASGYVVKGAGSDELVRAITGVAAGEAVLGAGVARRVLAELARPGPPPEPFPELTARERAILEALASGASNEAIARRLDIAPKTVRNNVSAVLAKLQVADRSAAIIKARDAGLGRG